MELKILHAADLHLDSPFGKLPPSERDAMKAIQRTIPEQLLTISRQEECDLWLLAGDLFDGAYTWESYRALYRAMADCGVPVFIAPGNHDYFDSRSVWTQKSWPENVYIFQGDMEAVELADLHCRVYGAGFTSMDCPPLLEGVHVADDGWTNLCILHGDPTGGASPYCPVTQEQTAASGFHYLALGHIHAAGSYRAGTTLCGWPGCPMGRGWDEAGAKGIYLVTVGETAALRSIPLGLPGFFDLTADITGGAEAALAALLPASDTDDRFRVTLTGCGQADLPRLRRKFGHLPFLELRDRTEELPDLWESAGENSFRGAFFDRLRQESEQTAAEEAGIVLLAAEISHRLMSGKEVTLP